MKSPRTDRRILTALLLQVMDSGDLSRSLCIPQPSACRTLTQMHEDGLVCRVGVKRNQQHRPAICYSLTSAGRHLAQQLIA